MAMLFYVIAIGIFMCAIGVQSGDPVTLICGGVQAGFSAGLLAAYYTRKRQEAKQRKEPS